MLLICTTRVLLACVLAVQRERRREFIVKYGLLNVRRVHGQERKRLPAEKEQYTKLRVFAR